MKKKSKLFVSFFLVLALVLQVAVLSLPMTAEEIPETPPETSGQTSPETPTPEVSAPVDLKKQIVPRSEVPAIIDYSVAVEKKYMRRAYEEEHSLNELAFQKTDGSFDIYSFAFPVKYETADGEILDKSPELVYDTATASFATAAQNDTALQCAAVAKDGITYISSKLNVTLKPKTPAEATFGLQILEGTVAPISGGILIKPSNPQIPAGYTANAAQVSAQSALTTRTETVTAAGYSLTEGNTMAVVPSYNGFNLSVSKASASTQNTFWYELTTGGKTLAVSNGTGLFTNADGTPAGTLSVMTEDSPADLEAIQIRPGQYLLSVTLPAGAAASTMAVTDYYDYLQDTTVCSGTPTTTYGSSANLYVGYQSSRGVERILIRPNQWYLDSPGYNVSSATLVMRDIMANTSSTVECRQFTGSMWGESSATWNSVSANSYGAIVSSLAVNSDIGWSNGYVYRFDITSIAQAWANVSGTHRRGLILKASNESSGQQYFASTQYGTESYRPYLDITVTYTNPLSDGIYFIRSATGGYLTSTESSLNGSNVYQKTNKLSTEYTDCMNQLWRVTDAGNGYYTIRPYHYTPAGLTASGYANSNTNVDIYDIGYSDYMEDLPSYALWSIYDAKNLGDGIRFSLSLMGSGWSLENYNGTSDGGNISIGDDYSGNEHDWFFDRVENPPNVVLFYNDDTGLREDNMHRWIRVGDENVRILAELDFDISLSISAGSLNPTQHGWSLDGSSIATLNTGTLGLTGVSAGYTRVCVNYIINGNTYEGGFTLHVWNQSINGVYYIQNAKSLQYVNIAVPGLQDGSTIEQNAYYDYNSLRWEFTLQNSGYYTIRSVLSNSTDYYLAVENDSTADGAQLVLRSEPATNAMEWEISTTADGRYKIVPVVGRTLGRAMAVEYATSQNSSGLKIKSLTYSNDNYYSDEWYLLPCYGTLEETLFSRGIISQNDIASTNDGFRMIKRSIGDMFRILEITVLNLPNNQTCTVSTDYACWYVFSITRNGETSYGLYYFGEQQDPHAEDPRVSISFAKFDPELLLDCFEMWNISMVNEALVNHISNVTVETDNCVRYDSIIREYFAETASEAPYLIAEEYISFIASTCNSQEQVLVPKVYKEALSAQDERTDRLVSAIESVDPNGTIYITQNDNDTSNDYIQLQDSQNLTSAEKYVILTLYTGDVNFNCFAAEVEYHAEKTNLFFGNPFLVSLYNRALCADMSTLESPSPFPSELKDPYHNTESPIVVEQGNEHGIY